MIKRYVGVREISEYTSLPVKTLYEWAGRGKIPSIKYGSRVLFDLHDIDSFMSSLKRDTGTCETIVKKVLENVL